MFYKSYGDGSDTYLAFHGWAGDHREFSAIAARVPEGACFISCDLPGYGETPLPTEWSLSSIIDQIEDGLGDFLDPMRKVTLIGFCSGVIIALLFAHRRPDCFKRIVMIDPFAFLPWYFRIFTLGEFGKRAYKSTFESPTGRKITDRILSSTQTSDADFTAAFTTVNHEVTRNYLKLLASLNQRDVFVGFDMPAEIALGEKTFGAVKKSASTIQSLWPGTEVNVLPRTGHLPLIKGARILRRIIFEYSSWSSPRLDATPRNAESSSAVTPSMS